MPNRNIEQRQEIIRQIVAVALEQTKHKVDALEKMLEAIDLASVDEPASVMGIVLALGEIQRLAENDDLLNRFAELAEYSDTHKTTH